MEKMCFPFTLTRGVSESARKGFSCVINISTGRQTDGESEEEEEKKKRFPVFTTPD